jgi:hypothetical protein
MAKSDDPGERFLVRLYNSTRSAEQDVELEKEKKIREALERSSAFKSELINLKDKLYESDHALEENEISELKLAIIVKKREIEDAEDKVGRLKE